MDNVIQKAIDGLRENFSENTIEYVSRELLNRGVKYHYHYIDRLDLRGSKVLDVGCGIGNWSIALEKNFDQVFSLEYNLERLMFSKALFDRLNLDISILQGSVLSLPFQDNFFDCVFCKGVIFLTDHKVGLSEIMRVVKPGGIVYFSYDSMQWWAYLIRERGPKNNNIISMSCEMLFNYILYGYEYFLDQKSINIKVNKVITTWIKINILKKFSNAFSNNTSLFKIVGSQESAYSDFLAKQLNEVVNLFDLNANPQQKKRLRKAIKSMRSCQQEMGFLKNSNGCSIEINDMEYQLEQAGASILGSSHEGGIIINPRTPKINSMYPYNQGIKETLAKKKNDAHFEKIRPIDLNLSLHYLKENINYTLRSNIVACDDYSILLYSHYLDQIKSIHYKSRIKKYLKSTINSYSDEEKQFMEIYIFLQKSLFHHPIFHLMSDFQAMGDDPYVLLYAGLAKCGQAAIVAKEIYGLFGYETKITQLYKHTFCEVKFKSKWRLVDVDFFKCGCYPKNIQGKWASLSEIKKNNVIIDACPMLGLQLCFEGIWAKNCFDQAVNGYVDTGLAWDRPYASSFYFKKDKDIYPEGPLNIIIKANNRKLFLDVSNIPSSVRKIIFYISKKKRDWAYTDLPNEDYLQDCKFDAGFFQLDDPASNETVDLALLDVGTYYISYYVLGDYEVNNPSVFVWPQKEICYRKLSAEKDI